MLSIARPELELILCCARIKIDLHHLDRIKILLQQDLDWEYFLTIARLHKVISLMYFNLAQLSKTYTKIVPPHVLKQLKSQTQATTANNLLFVRELLILTKLFESNEVAAIPYKGLILATSVYGDLSLRQFTDIDFLVSKQQYLKAQELLVVEGYKTPEFRNDVEWERSFIHEQRKIDVDLHQGLTPAYFPVQFDFEGLWQRLESLSVGGVKTKSFSSEDLLIVLCIQLAKDSQWTAETLLKVCDIAELLRVHSDINWNFIWQQCTILGTRKIVLFSLSVANNLLQAELPNSIQRKIATERIVTTAAAQVCAEFFQRSEQSFRERTFCERPYLRKLARERWQDKVRYVWQQAFNLNEKDFAFLLVPKHLSFLYYLLRPLRIIMNFVRY
ncbi:MAG: nucleotidyltransferase family protein [Cyanobacteria bacterium P01_G01_bin.67]